MSKERQYLTAVTIVGGIITLIDYNGNIVHYRQRGLNKLSNDTIKTLIELKLLNANWDKFRELPANISISFEDPTIMGRARASFPDPTEVIKAYKLANSTRRK